MGKLTRRRTRTRAQAIGKKCPTSSQNDKDLNSMELMSETQHEFKVPDPPKTALGNPFGGAKIDMSTLRTKLTTTDDDEDRMSFISKGSISKGKDQMKKKDKMKLRRERWLEKVETIQQSKKRRKDKMKRLKTPVVGDLEPMMSALPELSEIIQMSREAGKRADKRRQALGSQSKKNTLKAKQRQKLLNEERERFQQVLQHTAFKTNPFATINRHLSLKIQQENDPGES
ncbi:ribosome biogenesis protein SLX9 homolog [Apostichopus japonicus]|uniref:ribosome biogenesis protein SLX9 homolog n=1 Tax=Stichopus japonicus TaxID=307972 RepID=UPI003AB17C91